MPSKPKDAKVRSDAAFPRMHGDERHILEPVEPVEEMTPQTRPWAGAKIYQASSGSHGVGIIHHTGQTNVVFDTHSFYHSGGTLKIPFTGIYRVSYYFLCEPNAADHNAIAQIYKNSNPNLTGATRIAYGSGCGGDDPSNTARHTSFYQSSHAWAITSLNQNQYIMAASEAVTSGITTHGNSTDEQDWMAIEYVGAI